MRASIFVFYIAVFAGLAHLQAQADPEALYRERATIAKARQAAAIWETRLAKDPKDFESAWKLARAEYWLGGHDAETTTRALGIVGSMASGLFAYLADGTPTKPIHPAWAAHGAHLATRLAYHGAVGPRSVLEGKFGLYHAFLGAEEGEIDIAGQLADLGERWETARIAYKPFPVCHFMHGSLGAASDALRGRLLRADEIADVVVTVPEAGVSLVLEPADRKQAPRSEYEGKFSLQYSAASMLVRGHVAVGDFTDEAIADPEVLAVARKVRYETPLYPSYPQAFPGGIRITLASGETLAGDLPYQKGGPENPLSAAEVQAKVRDNARLVLSDSEIDALEEAILSLDRQTDLTAALAPLTLREVARV